MPSRRRILAALVASLTLAPAVPGWAGAVRPFDAGAFAAAQEAGRGIVVWVHAPW